MRHINPVAILILLVVVILVDIVIRILYCTNIHLSFNSQEFNNILSPIISFFGFVGVIVTILLTFKQNKHQQGSNYFNYYKEQINKLAGETPTKDNGTAFSTYDLLSFPIYVSNKYDDLKKDQDWLADLAKFKAGNSVKSEGKPYDNLILGNVRLFHTSLILLLKRYKSFINEIDDHDVLDKNQKQLLLKELFDTQVEKYYNGCWLVGYEEELKIIKDNLYFAFVPNMSADLLFFDNHFYDLKNFIDKRDDLKKLTIA
ncbi:hypothetical protein [Terrimonas pollutisoli]|uniref:hypothetical protein n=1 Tax=Terrimonas pollutisoli TaxID=3034147 RepID=UPI0023EC6866|nr:hypothetical protein [Terrimonas sp. H1YJ31]